MKTKNHTLCILFFFFFFKVCLLKPHFTVYETSVLWPGIKATILEWKQAVLTTGLAGKSWYTLFIFMCQPPKHSPWHRVTLKNVCWMSPCYSFNHDWLCDPMDCGPPGFSVHGIPQARIWGGVGSHSLLQGIFLIQGWNLSLLHCREILYHLSHQGSPNEYMRLDK